MPFGEMSPMRCFDLRKGGPETPRTEVGAGPDGTLGAAPAQAGAPAAASNAPAMPTLPLSGVMQGSGPMARQETADVDLVGTESRTAERQAIKLCLQRFTEMSAHLLQVEKRVADVEARSTAEAAPDPMAREASKESKAASRDLEARMDSLEALVERLSSQVAQHASSERVLHEVATSERKSGGSGVQERLDELQRRIDEALALKGPKVGEGEAEREAEREAEPAKDVCDVKVPVEVALPDEGEPGGPEADGASDAALLKAALSQDVSRKLGESLWDAALFIGSPLLSKCDSVVMVILIIATLIAQIVFLGITWLVFTQKQFSPEYQDKLEEWRMNVGHNVKYYDPLTFTSLTQRICDPDRYVSEMSSGTSSVIAQIQEYLGLNPFFNGPSLVKIAILLWGLTVVHEFMRAWDLVRVLKALPGGITQFKAEGGDAPLQLLSMHRGRKAWASIVLVIRVVSSGFLFVLGCMFLSLYSISVSEIILNAVALEIVLNIDEAMFALVPSAAKILLERLEPLPAPAVRSRVRGVDLRSLLFFFLLATTILACEFTAIQEVVTQVRAANSTLCSGRTDFVYSLDPFYLVYVTKTNPMALNQETIRKFGHIQAINETIYPELVPNQTFGASTMAMPMVFQFDVNGLEEVKKRQAYDIAQASAGVQGLLSLTCNNTLSLMPPVGRFVNESLDALDTTSVAGVRGCADAAPLCEMWPLVRSLCPSTCGCDDPIGKLFATGAPGGCPVACTSAGSYRTALEALPCGERTQAELASDALWQDWARQFHYEVDQAWKFEDGRPCANCTEYMLANGCGIVTKWIDSIKASFGWGADPCSGAWLNDFIRLKALSVYCPVTCGCSGTGLTKEALLQRHCPGTCVASSR